MINVELKAKHFYLVAEILFANAASTSFNTLSAIKTGCASAADDDLVTIDLPVGDVCNAYQSLTYKPEGQFNRINTEMFDMLTPQIEAGVTAGDEQWISLAQYITAARTQNLAVADAMIASGKSKLYSA